MMRPIKSNAKRLATVWTRGTVALALALGLALSAQGQPQFDHTWRVDASVFGGAEDGSSWADAFRHIQDALAAAAATVGQTDEIWVAAGTYYPDRDSTSPNGDGDRGASFVLLLDVSIYGGFLGTNHPNLPVGETGILQRDPEKNITVLSGDIDQDGLHAENSFHVVTAQNVDNSAVLNGFHIVEGNAGIAGGGGLFNCSADPYIVRCTFEDNHALGGGAVGCKDTYSGEPLFVNCRFIGNIASQDGGAINFFGSDFAEFHTASLIATLPRPDSAARCTCRAAFRVQRCACATVPSAAT
jgi:hypothetical protein